MRRLSGLLAFSIQPLDFLTVSLTQRRNQAMESLEAQLNSWIARYRGLARRNYIFAYILVVRTILSSAIAGIGGITAQLTSYQTAVIALVPAFCSLAASFLKPQARANWHYRMAARLTAFRRQLINEHADPANISAEWRSVDEEMEKIWEVNFGLDAAAIIASKTQV
jgi:hypothetical protein